MSRRAARVMAQCLVLTMGCAGLGSLAREHRLQSPTVAEPKTKSSAAVAGFAARADRVSGVTPVSKGEWGILIVDAATGETLYEKNADAYFVPASNMKLLTTALALDTLGPDYRFRSTIESNGTVDDGQLKGDLILAGRGDANLSNRKFPFDVKEEFEGSPERALSELADQVVAHGIKEITGDIIGDDSYFPRERYPDGWETVSYTHLTLPTKA